MDFKLTFKIFEDFKSEAMKYFQLYIKTAFYIFDKYE